jgi:hypothetical protein
VIAKPRIDQVSTIKIRAFRGPRIINLAPRSYIALRAPGIDRLIKFSDPEQFTAHGAISARSAGQNDVLVQFSGHGDESRGAASRTQAAPRFAAMNASPAGWIASEVVGKHAGTA